VVSSAIQFRFSSLNTGRRML